MHRCNPSFVGLSSTLQLIGLLSGPGARWVVPACFTSIQIIKHLIDQCIEIRMARRIGKS